jgi:N-methylhydantoinase A
MNIVESGPAGGVVGAQAVAPRQKLGKIITFDMGGTTAKASMVENGEVTRAQEYAVGAGIMIGSRLLTGAGYTLKVPAIDLAEVGAGGGSHVWIDAAALCRSDRRARAPRPVRSVTTRGGTVPTVTDANVLLGYINPQHPRRRGAQAQRREGARRVRRDHRGAAEDDGRGCGLWRISDRGVEHDPCDPRGIERARARSARVRAVRIRRQRAAVRRGMAAQLDIKRIVVPPCAGLFSSFGLLYADVEYHFSRTFRRICARPIRRRSAEPGTRSRNRRPPTRDRRIHRRVRADQALSRAALQGTDLRTGRTGDRRPDRRRDDVLS